MKSKLLIQRERSETGPSGYTPIGHVRRPARAGRLPAGTVGDRPERVVSKLARSLTGPSW